MSVPCAMLYGVVFTVVACYRLVSGQNPPPLALTDWGPAVAILATGESSLPFESCGLPSPSSNLTAHLVANANISLFTNPLTGANRCGQCVEAKCVDQACPSQNSVTVSVTGSCRCLTKSSNSNGTRAAQSDSDSAPAPEPAEGPGSYASLAGLLAAALPPGTAGPAAASASAPARCCSPLPSVELSRAAFAALGAGPAAIPGQSLNVWVRRVTCALAPGSHIQILLDTLSSADGPFSLRIANVAGPGSFASVRLVGSQPPSPSPPPTVPLAATWGATWEANLSSGVGASLGPFPWTIDATADTTGERIAFPGVIQQWMLRGDWAGAGTAGASQGGGYANFSLPRALTIETTAQLQLPSQQTGTSSAVEAAQGQGATQAAPTQPPGPGAGPGQLPAPQYAPPTQAYAYAQPQQPQPQYPQAQPGYSQAAAQPMGTQPSAAAAGAPGAPSPSPNPYMYASQPQAPAQQAGQQVPQGPQPAAAPLACMDSPAALVVSPSQPGPLTCPALRDRGWCLASSYVQTQCPVSCGLCTPSGAGGPQPQGPAGPPQATQAPSQGQQGQGGQMASQPSPGSTADQAQAQPQPQQAPAGVGYGRPLGPGFSPGASTGQAQGGSTGAAGAAGAAAGTQPSSSLPQPQAGASYQQAQSSQPSPQQPFSAVYPGQMQSMQAQGQGGQAAAGPGSMGQATAAAPGNGTAPRNITTVGGLTCTLPYTDQNGRTFDSCVQFQSISGAKFCYTSQGLWDVCQSET